MSDLRFYSTAKENHKIREAARWIVDIFVVLSLAVFVGYVFFYRIPVSGLSMEPTLTNGDQVCVNTALYTFTEPERLDVICFRLTTNEDEDRMTIKRIIGLPGETIQIRDSHVYINGARAYLADGFDVAALGGIADQEITLGENEYFVLGDNRENSEDSRFSSIGNVKRSQILGKVWVVVAPVTHLGLLD